MAHIYIPEAEEILDKEFKCLDKGFIRLIDYMGSDARIVQSARVSYGIGTKTIREDTGLINYLMKNQHTSPFEMVELNFHLKMPIFVARQWLRTRTASLNEISGRYSIMVDEFYLPSPDRIAFQSKDNKQGSSPETVPDELKSNVLRLLLEEQKLVYTGYEQMLEDNIAKELSRINLPLSLYTEFYWKIDLHNLFKMMKLRIDDHAQYEIRVYANRIMDIVSKVAPIATEAFIEHVLYAKTFSRKEMEVLRVMSNQSDMNTDHINEMLGEKKAKEFLFKIRGF